MRRMSKISFGKARRFESEDFEKDFDLDERSFIGIELGENTNFLEDLFEQHWTEEEWFNAFDRAEGIVDLVLDKAGFYANEKWHDDYSFCAYCHGHEAGDCVAFAKAAKEKTGTAGDVWTLNEDISYVSGLTLGDLCELVGINKRKLQEFSIPIEEFECSVAFETKFKDLVED